MNNLIKNLVLALLINLLVFGVSFLQAKAQGPLPPDLAQGAQPPAQGQVLRMPPVDVKKLLQEDKQRAIQGLPLRFAQPIPVEVSPGTHGIWKQLDAATWLWRLRIISADALSLNLGFSRYVMPLGGRLFLYTPDYKQVVGPFTAKDNEVHGQLWTPLLSTAEIIIEVILPAEAVSQLELELSSVNHGYVEFGQARFIQPGACNVDVICAAGDNWRDEIRSVARYTIKGTTFCSGSLLNNTAQDFKPYFLTAKHCGPDGVNPTSAPTMVLYWNYETSICNGVPPDGSLTQFNTGAIFRSAYTPTDFALVELDDPITSTFNVYWAGWDNTNTAPTSAATIHHPGGYEKRISLENDPTLIATYLSSDSPGDSTHLRVIDWDLGTTEGGSSGAPLFNQNKRVVGQLHGGYASCNNNLSDWYGRLFVSWTGGGTADTRLQDWLDPLNTGATTLDGTNYKILYFLPVVWKN